jgi:3-oxoacyl-[acyl-carrier protein] reductase
MVDSSGRAYAKRLAGLGAKLEVADLNLRSYVEFEAEARDMTADSTIAEIEAAGGTALGIEVRLAAKARRQSTLGTSPRRRARAEPNGPATAPAASRSGSERGGATSLRSHNLTGRSPKTRPPSADGGYAHYGAAKAAIAHYTRYLAQDLGPFGITANCIAPGLLQPAGSLVTVIPGSSQSNRDRAELVALRRLGTVEDCARCRAGH